MITIKNHIGDTIHTSEALTLRDAVQRAPNLCGADLRGADLRQADLQDANLRHVNLCGADLRHADLRNADLRHANLRHANLRHADLQDADLRGADLCGAKDVPSIVAAQSRIIPEGSIIGWKKAYNGALVKLRIPEDAQRSNASGRKCRADRAEVLAIYARDGQSIDGPAYSQHDPNFIYMAGETVTPREPFDTDPWNECASGIHFFITREEAEVY